MKKRKMYGIIGMMFTLVLAFAMTTTAERGELFWGDTYTGPIDAPGSATVSKNFDKAVNYTSTSSTGKLRATSIAHIKSPKDGKRYQFSMSVVPTIFD